MEEVAREPYGLYFSPNTSIIGVTKSRMDGRGKCHVWGAGEYRVLARKPEGRRPLVRLRSRWEDNVKMDFQEIGWGHGLD
jgi:hypothetical protein